MWEYNPSRVQVLCVADISLEREVAFRDVCVVMIESEPLVLRATSRNNNSIC